MHAGGPYSVSNSRLDISKQSIKPNLCAKSIGRFRAITVLPQSPLIDFGFKKLTNIQTLSKWKFDKILWEKNIFDKVDGALN